MHVTLVRIHVRPEHVADFIDATRKNHEGSVREPGNLRFDVLQLEEDPARFVLYEVYRAAEDAAAHKDTAHYKAWRQAVDGWMASTREGKRYRPLAPADPERFRS